MQSRFVPPWAKRNPVSCRNKKRSLFSWSLSVKLVQHITLPSGWMAVLHVIIWRLTVQQQMVRNNEIWPQNYTITCDQRFPWWNMSAIYYASVVYIKIISPCSCTYFTTAATLSLQNTKSLTLGEKLYFLSYNYAPVWVGLSTRLKFPVAVFNFWWCVHVVAWQPTFYLVVFM